MTEQRHLDVLRDAFLAAVSHELRTPLTVFKGVADDRPQPGTGIGLALIAEFARTHGGRAWVKPQAAGAEFIVEIQPTHNQQPVPPDRTLSGDAVGRGQRPTP